MGDVAVARSALQEVVVRIGATEEQATFRYTLPALALLNIMARTGYVPQECYLPISW